VTDDLDQQVRQALQRRRRSPRVFLYVCLLAAVTGTSGYLWLNYDRLAKLAFAERSSAAPVADTGVAQMDFEALKRQTAESLQSTIEDIDAQKAELKRLSDQVSALAAKIDALQSPAVSAPQQAAVPVRPPVIAARKKPPAPKTSGPISVGGSPLPTAPSADR
jgi:phage shock protein A